MLMRSGAKLAGALSLDRQMPRQSRPAEHAADRSRLIAIVCDTVPFPFRSGDNTRIAEMIHALRSQGWFVHLILARLIDRTSRNLCRSHVDALHVYAGRGLWTRCRNLVRRVARFCDKIAQRLGYPPLEDTAARILGRPLSSAILDYWQRYPAGLDEFLACLAQRYPWKALIAEYIWLHRAIDKLPPGILRLLDTHDVQHKRVEEYASRGLSFPLKITREEEGGIFSGFDAVIAIQSQEASLIRAMCPDLRVLTVGTGGLESRPKDNKPVAGRILYVGGYNGANVDGLDRFLKHSWPDIIRRCPNAHLHICGYIYRAFLNADFPNVKFLGHVTDLGSQYAEAEIMINPVWIGTGLKIKTVEALAACKPFATTEKGVEGIDGEVKSACLVATDEKDFAEKVIRLLSDVESRNSLAQSAASFASVYLSQSRVYRELLTFLDEAK